MLVYGVMLITYCIVYMLIRFLLVKLLSCLTINIKLINENNNYTQFSKFYPIFSLCTQLIKNLQLFKSLYIYCTGTYSIVLVNCKQVCKNTVFRDST